MIDYELYCKIRDYHQNRHLSVRQIAHELHLDPRTVERWLAARVPHVPLKMLPMDQVRCVLATERLSEVVRLLTQGDEQLLLVETEDRVLLGALSRDELSQISDWAPLWAARKQRLGESFENLKPVVLPRASVG